MLRARYRVRVTETVHLLGIDRIHIKAVLDQAFNNGAPWHLDADRRKPWLYSSQFFQALYQLCHPRPSMFNRFPVDHTSIAIDDTHFMALRRPVNSYEPTVLSRHDHSLARPCS